MNKIFTGIILLSFLIQVSCSSPSEKEILESEIKIVTTKYWSNKVKEETTKTNEIILLDSVVLVSIDTFSSSDLLTLKYNALNSEFYNKEKDIQISLDKYKLNNLLGVYKGAEELAEMELKDLEKEKDDLAKIANKMTNIENELNSNPDSTNLLYYLVMSSLYLTENGTTEKNMEVGNLVTKSFKIKEIEDIISE